MNRELTLMDEKLASLWLEIANKRIDEICKNVHYKPYLKSIAQVQAVQQAAQIYRMAEEVAHAKA